jgi:hypothetical protein
LANISVGSFFTIIEAEGTISCPLLLKKFKKVVLISFDVISYYKIIGKVNAFIFIADYQQILSTFGMRNKYNITVSENQLPHIRQYFASKVSSLRVGCAKPINFSADLCRKKT